MKTSKFLENVVEMNNNEKRKRVPEREGAKRIAQNVNKKRKYVEGKEKQIKREGTRITKKLEHKGKISNFEAVDRIAKARKGRVHESGVHKEGTSVKGQYFRTGLAREEILRQKTPTIRTKPKVKHRPQRISARIQERKQKTAVNKPVELASSKSNQTRNRRLTSADHRPSPAVKMPRKLVKIPIKSKEQPNRSYAEIRDTFELASGGRNVQQNKKLITAHPEALRDETNRKNQKIVGPVAIKPAPKPEIAQLENETVENGLEEGEEEETLNEEKKPKKIFGVKLVGLGSKAEKTSNKPVTSQHQNSRSPTRTMKVNTLTRHKIQKREKNLNGYKIADNAAKMHVDLPFGDDPTLVARRVRKVPGKYLKRHELVLEEIHELPPITVEKKMLKRIFPDKNPEKFAELRKKYRILNSMVTARLSLEKCAIFAKIACLGLYKVIRNMFKEGKIGNENLAVAH